MVDKLVYTPTSIVYRSNTIDSSQEPLRRTSYFLGENDHNDDSLMNKHKNVDLLEWSDIPDYTAIFD